MFDDRQTKAEIIEGGMKLHRLYVEAHAKAERLRAALESLTKDPPATLDEPDEDWEVIIKMRAIARSALAGDTRPIEVIVREARDAWPDHPQRVDEQVEGRT